MSAQAPDLAAAALSGLDEVERRLVRFAQRLVATPSLPGEEAAVADLLVAELETLGYREIERDEHGNVVARIGSGPNRLMFNGHVDHVPPAAMDDPYGAQIVDAAAYGGSGFAIRGRGSCDMKANVAAGAYAAAFLDPQQLRDGTYVFTADVQEETDSPLGVPALLERGIRAEYGLSGESTQLDLYLGHRGKIQVDVTVKGRSSHASTPEDGVNAVYRAIPFLRALEQMPRTLPADELYGRGTVTVTDVRADPGAEVAVVPSGCTIRIDRRYVPSETPESALAEIRALVERVGRETGTAAEVALVNVYPLMSIPADHPLVDAGRAAIAAVTGSEPRLKTWRFGVNATFMGAAGIPTIGIGPGSEDFAHTRDEHVPIDQLVRASRIYADLIVRLCDGRSDR
ncbi:M20/M25/M40 family metallo-hydrolase [Conexibacter arvalis]|uniref:Succinyl-diaminopimelate desuccinylase n=1 Tax=Conexibacter arvalis TaxID=912552 RepID=A0A840ID65_9ACTN|nr:M20/M25/M40 family metallo-hydrolase [Conexibacter arvalis]MBB4662173.1 succinyl-diaminopimelate desuccinylase [Conexibacter arvalis]